MEGDGGGTVGQVQQRRISIHSLRMEGDAAWAERVKRVGISIHSLRMEGDYILTPPMRGNRNFNPLPPYGGRPWAAG